LHWEAGVTKVVTYIDGFNLYFGLRDSGWRKYYWLDLVTLARNLLKPDQVLTAVHYFTARLCFTGNNQADINRQDDYLDSLRTLPELTIHFGHYLEKNRKCRRCGSTWIDHEEKMTDVNIATQLLLDGFHGRFDTALLISADSDLTTPVAQLRSHFPAKRVIVVQPPKRNSTKLRQAASASFTLGEANLRQSQLPSMVTTSSGYVLSRPDYWK
jgi:uncharacterized LabA/DUF88 family protein